jgi:NAD-dependent dihydropyrimidine dehydrogenase PreA subunit
MLNFRSRINSHSGTPFIHLNTRQCKACWKCIEVCPHHVIGKIDFLGHRHAVIRRSEECTGCLRCLKACTYNAIHKVES